LSYNKNDVVIPAKADFQALGRVTVNITIRERDVAGEAAPGWIGRSVLRLEDARLVTGAGRFVGDLAPPDCLHLEFFRSAHARGRIADLDVAAARAAPNVVAVYTADDLGTLGQAEVNPLIPDIKVPPFRLLAQDSVEAVGQPVLAVIAHSAAAARDAVAQIHMAVDEMSPGRGDDLALAHRWTAGDVEAAFSEAAHVVRVGIEHPRLAPMPIEPRAAMAAWDDASGMLTVWLSTQTPHRARTDLANILSMPASRVRVVAPDVGGAFGGKASIYPEDAMVAFAARALRKPVKWGGSRSEDFLAATHGRGGRTEGALALCADGRIVGLRANLAYPLGHWMPYSGAVPGRNAGRILPGPYRVQNVDIALEGRLTSTAALGIYRGAGRPEACMLMERLMDRAASALGMDPIELRRRNLIAADAFPYRTPTGETLDSGDYPALLDKAAARAAYKDLCKERARRRRRNEVVGIGCSLYIEPCGQGWESARVGLLPDGIVVVATGSSAQGQGRETAYTQIVCDTLGLPMSRVRIAHGDTQHTPAGIGALASRATAIGGSAVLLAARAFLKEAKAAAGELLDCSPFDLVVTTTGLACAQGHAVSWEKLARHAHGHGIGLSDGLALTVTEKYYAEGEAWSSGCCIAAVSADADTGELTIERLVWVDDAGVVVNPTLVEGQLLGGLAQGLGEATRERIVYDEDGQLVTASLMDYAVPRARDMPAVDIEKMHTPSPANVLGAKGVGEAGCIGVPAAIVNAAIDAVSPYGVTHLDIPLTSETIWRAINTGHAKGSAHASRRRQP
jgi:carbon-monoxide dehydrogenase large subunit